jgi:hypothetical protein
MRRLCQRYALAFGVCYKPLRGLFNANSRLARPYLIDGKTRYLSRSAYFPEALSAIAVRLVRGRHFIHTGGMILPLRHSRVNPLTGSRELSGRAGLPSR